MSEIAKCCLTFPPYTLNNEEEKIHKKIQIRIKSEQLTFSIGNIKCRNQAVIYFKFYGFDYHNTLITEYTSERWLITSNYEQEYETFNLTFVKGKDYRDLDNCYMEIYTLGIDSENPLYFNRLQLNNGELEDYHTPNEEIINTNIGFNKNRYINLYDEDNILQVIRPNHEDISTEQLTSSQKTILAPHLPNESKWDDPVAIFYEFMYMTEQKIGVEK